MVNMNSRIFVIENVINYGLEHVVLWTFPETDD